MIDIANASRTAREIAGIWLVLGLLAAMSGCRGGFWQSPDFARPQHLAAPRFSPEACDPRDPIGHPASGWRSAAIDHLAAAEQSYAEGSQLEDEGRAECVDSYYHATVTCWPHVERGLGAADRLASPDRAWDLYHSSLAKVISTGQTWGRLDPRRGLTVSTPHGAALVRVQHVGAPWMRDDFTHLTLVGDYSHKRLTNAYRRSGLGVPVVVRSANKSTTEFIRPHQVFAATAVLRSTCDASDGSTGQAMPTGVTLDLIDPFRVESLPAIAGPFPIAADMSAPIALRMMPRDRNPWRGFIQRGYSTSEDGLYMIEPYQPGKIPLIFVHGLLSDPLTWADLANELRARADIIARYQLWAFEYPTGQPFLRSAATFREELQTVRHQVDPLYQDRALDQMVLIGHSLGGLVSKLQVSASGGALWNTIANQPLDRIRADGPTKTQLAKLFFFQPVPSVKRVIFIGTPHRGSALARRCIGRIGASLVSEPAEQRQQRLQLVADNPDVFAPELRRRTPTSIDLLEPNSRLLQAIETLPISGAVRLHSIIGTGYPMVGSGDADGVVPVTSARHTGVSEKLVDARHEGLHRAPDSVAEVIRILRAHAIQCVP